MIEFHGQNSALNPTVKPLRIAQRDCTMLIYEKLHHFNSPHYTKSFKLYTISFHDYEKFLRESTHLVFKLT